MCILNVIGDHTSGQQVSSISSSLPEDKDQQQQCSPDDNDGDGDDSIFDDSKSESEASMKESESMLNNNYEETNILDSEVPGGPQTESKVKVLLQDSKNHGTISKYLCISYCNT